MRSLWKMGLCLLVGAIPLVVSSQERTAALPFDTNYKLVNYLIQQTLQCHATVKTYKPTSGGPTCVTLPVAP